MKYIFLVVLLLFTKAAFPTTKVSIFKVEVNLPGECSFSFSSVEHNGFNCREQHEEFVDSISISFNEWTQKRIEKNISEPYGELDIQYVSHYTAKLGDLTHTIHTTKLAGIDFYTYYVCEHDLLSTCIKLSAERFDKIHYVVQQLSKEVLSPNE